ncbi:hypothetical protein M3Y95_01240800 [Aphelenchoides besseyi]|nr:hypothetical protein M3Y95_01240800 [Aphelenchoides besseyi]
MSIVLLIVFIFTLTATACNPTTFVVPLMRSDIGCYKSTGSDLHRRKKEIVIIPPFNQTKSQTFDCNNPNTCEPYAYNRNLELALKPGTNYTVKGHFERQAKSNAGNCINDSIALLLTDISCSQYSKYPDLEQLFSDDNLKQTIQWLTDLRLLTVIFYLSHSKPEPCTQLANYKFNNETDYLRVYQPTYFSSTFDPFEVRAEFFATDLYEGSNFFLVQIGSPPQEMYVTHSLVFSQTVYLDINCGHRPSCSRYCKDERFKKMYCTPICRAEITKSSCNQGLPTLRNTTYAYFHFWPQNSSSFQLMNKNDWYSNTFDYDEQSGKHFTDTLTFLSDGDYTANLTLKDANVIDGLLLMIEFFQWSGGVVGLAPGDGNIVAQLYAQKLISLPSALFVMRNDGYTGLLSFGIDPHEYEYCDENWTQHPTQSPDQWILELEDFELNGLSYGKKTKALLNAHDSFILLPQEFIQRAYNLGILDFYDGPEINAYAYTFPCDQPLEWSLKVDGQYLTISNSSLLSVQIDNNTCASYLAVRYDITRNHQIELCIN